jgi:hypothetical protein
LLQSLSMALPYEAKVYKKTILKDIMEEALEKTYNSGRPLSDWEIKDFNGKMFSPSQTVEDILPITDNLISLSLKAGWGGSLAA